MASVKKVTVHGNDRWQLRWRDADGKPGKRNFETAREANRERARIEHELHSGTYVDTRAGKVTFAEYAEAWREAQPHRPNTARRVRSNLEQHIYPAIGSRPLTAVRPSEVQALVGRLSVHLNPSSVRIIFATLRSVFRVAVRDRLIPYSPALDIAQPQVRKARVVPLVVEQVEALADALPRRYWALIIVAAGLGLRPGEAFGLRVCDVDFLRKFARVEQQNQPGEDGAPLKTESSYRRVPIPEVVLHALVAHLREYPAKREEHIFTDEKGEPLDDQSFKHTWLLARRQAGLTRVRLHDLRHFYASVLIAAGRSVKEVSERLGHKNAAETLNTYSHLWPTDDDGTRAAVDAAFNDEGREERAAG
jgi:integrase